MRTVGVKSCEASQAKSVDIDQYCRLLTDRNVRTPLDGTVAVADPGSGRVRPVPCLAAWWLPEATSTWCANQLDKYGD